MHSLPLFHPSSFPKSVDMLLLYASCVKRQMCKKKTKEKKVFLRTPCRARRPGFVDLYFCDFIQGKSLLTYPPHP